MIWYKPKIKQSWFIIVRIKHIGNHIKKHLGWKPAVLLNDNQYQSRFCKSLVCLFVASVVLGVLGRFCGGVPGLYVGAAEDDVDGVSKQRHCNYGGKYPPPLVKRFLKIFHATLVNQNLMNYNIMLNQFNSLFHVVHIWRRP